MKFRLTANVYLNQLCVYSLSNMGENGAKKYKWGNTGVMVYLIAKWIVQLNSAQNLGLDGLFLALQMQDWLIFKNSEIFAIQRTFQQ